MNYKGKNICNHPFSEIEIDSLGDVYCCCKYHLPVSFGNIYQNSFEEVWNSENAQKIRQNIMNEDYSLCNKNACVYLAKKNFDGRFDIKEKDILPKMKKYPKYVSFCHDKECNLACIICRDKIWRHTEESLEKLNNQIETKFLPMLKDAEYVSINAHGDPIASRHSRLLIKKIHKKYPKIKFEIFSNGTLLDENHLKELGIVNNLYNVKMSIHSAHKETYAKIIRNGEFYYDRLMQNIHYLSELRKKYHFGMTLLFVTTALNYQDIPDFIRLAENLNAVWFVSEYSDEQLQSCEKHPEWVITNKNHLEYKNLVKVLHDKVFNEISNNNLSEVLKQIQQENID